MEMWYGRLAGLSPFCRGGILFTGVPPPQFCKPRPPPRTPYPGTSPPKCIDVGALAAVPSAPIGEAGPTAEGQMGKFLRPSRCENCGAYEPPAVDNGQPGDCREGPPHASVFMLPGPGGQPQQIIVTTWPKVNKDQWCRRHTAGIQRPALAS